MRVSVCKAVWSVVHSTVLVVGIVQLKRVYLGHRRQCEGKVTYNVDVVWSHRLVGFSTAMRLDIYIG